MKPITLNKTEQLLLYIISCNPQVPVTSLMKISYLTDLISIGEDQPQISTFEYRRYNFGPFDKKIYDYIEVLTRSGLIESKTNYVASGEYITYSVNENADMPLLDAISSEEKTIIDSLMAKVRGYGAKTLTEIAYKTKPMLALGATLGGNEHLNEKLNLLA